MPLLRSSRSRSDESRLFGIGTGLVSAVVVVLVAGIAFILVRESSLSLRRFGLDFWRTSKWDPVSGEFGALPFLWGTLYSSFLALLIATPVAAPFRRARRAGTASPRPS
jgi:phosphate transport system permease protein